MQPFCCGFFRLGHIRTGCISPLRLPVASWRGWRCHNLCNTHHFAVWCHNFGRRPSEFSSAGRRQELQVRQARLGWEISAFYWCRGNRNGLQMSSAFFGLQMDHQNGIPSTSMNPCMYVMWCNAMQCNVMQCNVMLCNVMLSDVMSCHIMSVSCHVMSCDVMLYQICYV